MHTAPFFQRRQQLIEQMQAQGGGIAILPTAPEMTRNSDNHFPYRHDSYFYYLSGFTEPEAVLVLIADASSSNPDSANSDAATQTKPSGQSILFCRDKNPEMEIWDGFRFGPAAAQTRFGFDQGFSISQFETQLAIFLETAPQIFYSSGYDASFDSSVQNAIRQVRGKSRAGIKAPLKTHDLRYLIDAMRLIKDQTEIDLMQTAARISSSAHARAMRHCKPGIFEYQLEAEILHEFRYQGAASPAYGSIVAAGANACILHYQSNQAQIQDGDLILIDAGCEYQSYASDISRTFPASGKFSAAQKTLYELVLAAQLAALNCAKPGSLYQDGHHAAIRVLTQGMLETGLLDSNKVGTLDDAIASQAYRQFYMHGTGHWLGLDVHDAGEYRDPNTEGANRPYRKLEAGMVLTIEPGIYVRPAPEIPQEYWNIGIRIEDDILITAQGHLNLSADCPKTVAEIEAEMR